MTDFQKNLNELKLTDDIQGNSIELISILGIEPLLSTYFKLRYQIEDTPTIADMVHFLNIIAPEKLASAVMCMEAYSRAGYGNNLIRPAIVSCFVDSASDVVFMKQANNSIKPKQQLNTNQMEFVAKSVAHNVLRNKEFDYSFLSDIRHMSIAFYNEIQWKDLVYKKYNEFVIKMGHSPINFTNKLMYDLLSYKYKTGYSNIKRFNMNHHAIINNKKAFISDYTREIAHMMISSSK